MATGHKYRKIDRLKGLTPDFEGNLRPGSRREKLKTGRWKKNKSFMR